MRIYNFLFQLIVIHIVFPSRFCSAFFAFLCCDGKMRLQ